MTPESLHTYLRTRGFDEDTCQQVIVAYLSNQRVIQYPKAWAWKVAVHVRGNEAIRAGRSLPLPSDLVSREADPLRQASGRQLLKRAMIFGKKRRRGRPRMGGVRAWRADYRALLHKQRTGG